jgi:16S rRNA (cytosine1402-N4)-methyltransferase
MTGVARHGGNLENLTATPPAGTSKNVPGAFHTVVLADEVCRALAPALAFGPDRPGAPVLVDATCGSGGHSLALVRASHPDLVILIDRDPAALAQTAETLREVDCSLRFVHAPFSKIGQVLESHGVSNVAAIVADLGVSSHQLDTPDRGFSFQAEGPLDMRMDPTSGTPAGELIESLDAEALSRILREYGEEPEATRIAAAIVAARPRTTRSLAAVVEASMSARRRRQLARRIHPATRTFLALRIYVNRELEELEAFLEDAPELLVVGGRLAVITFHSLEDRRVKRRMRLLTDRSSVPAGVPLREVQLPMPAFRIPSEFRGGKTPEHDELARNPRSRSARLRVLERCAQ